MLVTGLDQILNFFLHASDVPGIKFADTLFVYVFPIIRIELVSLIPTHRLVPILPDRDYVLSPAYPIFENTLCFGKETIHRCFKFRLVNRNVVVIPLTETDPDD